MAPSCFQAIQSLSKLSHSKPGLDKLFHSDLLAVLKDVMATSDIIRYRIYEVVDSDVFIAVSIRH